jgi:hypothetical protein
VRLRRRAADEARTLGERSMPDLNPGEAIGVPNELTIGTSAAHTFRAASALSSSSGGPEHTLVEASVIV